jgi:hypothetical protein
MASASILPELSGQLVFHQYPDKNATIMACTESAAVARLRHIIEGCSDLYGQGCETQQIRLCILSKHGDSLLFVIVDFFVITTRTLTFTFDQQYNRYRVSVSKTEEKIG